MATPKDWLTQDGAPWRPFEDSGTLVKPLRTPRKPGAILAACEGRLLVHLKATCLWPEAQRDKGWRIGDYSYYILEFSPARGTEVFAQFWSEPDEEAVTLATRGLENDTTRSISVGSARDVRTAARAAIATLCNGLGYDGRVPLTFRLHLGTRLKPGLAFETIRASDLAKLMRRWGYPAAIETSGHTQVVASAIGLQPFLVAFAGERPKGSSEYGMVGLRTLFRLDLGAPDGLMNEINHNSVAVRASVDEDGDLIVETPILLHGGVTEANLEMSFGIWKKTIEEIARGLCQ